MEHTNQLLIVIRGGILRNVISNFDGFKIHVIDHTNMKEDIVRDAKPEVTDLPTIEKVIAEAIVEHAPLSMDRIKQMPPYSILAQGKGDGFFWVAQRGWIADWAVYSHPTKTGSDILDAGEKIRDRKQVQLLTNCTTEALRYYRQ